MSLTPADVKKMAHLARLNLSEDDVARYTPQLTAILQFVEQMNAVNTDHIIPLTHTLTTSQPLRADHVTEIDQRAAFQAIAPQVENGLYLVPKVIDGE